MTPATLRLTLITGTTFGPVVITCKDSEDAAVDLTGWSAFAEVRQSVNAAVVLDLAPEVTDAAAGEITIALSDEDTADLTPGSFVWDLILENAAGQRLGPYVAGSFVIRKPVTQPA
jgi:hypothetical protein